MREGVWLVLTVVALLTACAPVSTSPPSGNDGVTTSASPAPPTTAPSSAPPAASPPAATAAAIPSRCGKIGADGYEPPPYDVPALDLATRGTVITVTSAGDAVDGDTGSAAALIARPGADGITLREAVEASNRAPAPHAITFAPTLKGARIPIGPAGPLRLIGGDVFISGDVDGDGRPDVTLTDRGIEISSSRNRVHALAIEGAFGAVSLTTSGAIGKTFSENVISALTVSRSTFGIALSTQSENDAKIVTVEGRSTWRDTRVIGNSIDVANDAIVVLGRSVNDTIDGLVVARNTVTFGPGPGAAAGINLTPGFRAGARSQRMMNVLIAANVIEGRGSAGQLVGIWASAGPQGGSANSIDGMRIVANKVTMPVRKDTTGIELAVADGASDDYDKGIQPIVFPEDNAIRNVRIDGNVVTGAGRQGIWLFGGCCGGHANAIEQVDIEGNFVEASLEPGADGGIVLWGGDSGDFEARPTRKSLVQHVRILRNTIAFRASPDRGADVSTAAIALRAGSGASENVVADVTISGNRIQSDPIAITLVGGRGDRRLPTTANEVRAVAIDCNAIATRPSVRVAGLTDPRAIMLIGGSGTSKDNAVEASIRDTLVVDRLNDVGTIADLGAGAAGNRAVVR